MFALLVAAALAQDCDCACDPSWAAWECEIFSRQCQEDCAEAAARAANPEPASAWPERVDTLNTAPTEPPSDQVVPYEDPQGNVHVPEGPYGPIESLREQGESGFDRPGPTVLEVPAEWTVEGNTIYIPIEATSPPVPVSPPAPVEEPPPADSPAPE